jgi:hypothetical protein
MLEQLKVDSADPDWAAQLRTVARDYRRLARATAGSARTFIQTHAHAA